MVGQLTESVSSFLFHHGGYSDLCVLDYSLTRDATRGPNN